MGVFPPLHLDDAPRRGVGRETPASLRWRLPCGVRGSGVGHGLETAATLAGADVDDRDCDRLDIGVWYGKKYPDTKCGIFRKRFTVPAAWQTNGRT